MKVSKLEEKQVKPPLLKGNNMNAKLKQTNRKNRVTNKVKEVSSSPRLHVYRTNQHTYAQIIEKSGKIIASASDKSIKKGTKTQKAVEVGRKVAEMAIKNKVTAVAFDRGSYRYHGRVKSLADAAREAGLQF